MERNIKLKNLALILLATVLFISCNRQINNVKSVERFRINDSTYIEKTFQGQFLVDSSVYVGGEKKGMSMSFIPEDSIYVLFNSNSQGIVSSPVSYYNLNGGLISTGNMIENQKIGKWSYYSAKGLLTSYEYYRFPDKPYFLCKYDENGLIKEVEGTPINYITANPDTILSVGDKLITQLQVVPPPKSKMNLYGIVKDSDNQSLNKKNRLVEYNDSIYLYKLICSKKGKFSIYHYWELLDEYNKILANDSLIVNIYVN